MVSNQSPQLKVPAKDFPRFAEVRYYCFLHGQAGDATPVAVVDLFGEVDPWRYEFSHKTYRSCMRPGPNSLAIIHVKAIKSVIAMVPDTTRGEPYFHAVRKPGHLVDALAGVDELELGGEQL
jgi:hypothetical protein